MKTLYARLKLFFSSVVDRFNRFIQQPRFLPDFFPKGSKRVYFTLVFFLACQFFSFTIHAQTNPTYTRSYLNNVVDIGLSDYGIITAEDTANLYFIAVRRSKFEKDAYPEKIANTIKQVKFFGGAYKPKATKVTEFPFGAFTVVLYKSPLPPTATNWQRNYYFSLAHKKGKFSTFRDKWLSDKIWSVQEGKITVGKALKNGVYTLNVPLEAGIAKGMPLINSEGFIAGIFAESTLGKTVTKLINMKEIADALYVAGKNSCKYFNMIEWGQSDMRCVLEYNAKIEAEEKAKMDAEAKAKKLQHKGEDEKPKDSTLTVVKTKRTPKNHFLDYGLNANISTMPGMDNSNGKDNYLKTRAFHVGISLHLNIDKTGKNRITLKPRYGNFYERKDAGLWVSPDNNVSIASTSYQFAEMPVVLERQLVRGKKFSIAVGGGYAPGWVFGHKYSWYQKTGSSPINETIASAGTILTHRVLGELYLYEAKFGRIGFVYTKDLTAYPNADYAMTVAGNEYKPFAERKKSWFVGVEIGIRLRGGWAR
jgi:hypothetical protein